MPKKLSKTAHHTTKTAHSDIQNGPLSLSAFGNVQSDLEILYVEASYTQVRGVDDSETVKCSEEKLSKTCLLIVTFLISSSACFCRVQMQYLAVFLSYHNSYIFQQHVDGVNHKQISKAVLISTQQLMQ